MKLSKAQVRAFLESLIVGDSVGDMHYGFRDLREKIGEDTVVRHERLQITNGGSLIHAITKRGYSNKMLVYVGWDDQDLSINHRFMYSYDNTSFGIVTVVERKLFEDN